MMNNLFGVGKFRELSQSLTTSSATLHIVLKFLKSFPKFRQNPTQNFIQIEYTFAKFAEENELFEKFNSK